MAANRVSTAESLSFERRGEAFALVRVDKSGKRSEMILSASNVLFLPRIIQDVIHRIMSSRASRVLTDRGALPIVAVPVVEVQLNTDIHKSEILLTMCDGFGNRSSFALPFEVAKPLGARLPARVDEIEKMPQRALPQ